MSTAQPSGIDWSAYRPSEWSLLCGLLHRARPCPPLLIHGGSATGKTRAVLDRLATIRACHAFVDAAALTSERALMAAIIKQLARTDDSTDSDSGADWLADTSSSKRVTLPSSAARDRSRIHLSGAQTSFRGRFAEFSRRVSELRHLTALTGFIVVKHAEMLRAVSDAATDCLLRIGEACSRSITVIFLVDSADAGALSASVPMLPVHFPPYSRAEMASIVSSQLWCADASLQREMSMQEYSSFVSAMSEALGESVNDARELMHAAAKLTPIMRARHVQQSTQMDEDGGTAAASISDTYHIRGMRDELLQVTGQLYTHCPPPTLPSCGRTRIPVSRSQSFLLLSLFIACHVPQQRDADLFTTERRGGKRAKAKTAVSASVRHLLEPKFASLARVLAITQFLSGDRSMSASQCHTDMAALIELSLAERSTTANGDLFAATRYRSRLAFDHAETIAKEWEIELHPFMQTG